MATDVTRREMILAYDGDCPMCLSIMTPERMSVGLIAVVPTLLFTQLGIRWSRHISETTFHRILLALFVVMELKLLIDILYSMSA